MIEPVYPLQGGQFYGFLGFPRSPAVYLLSFVEPIDRFCQCIVITVASTAHRRFYASLCQPPAVPNGYILGSAV